jgi:hypothetical protein
MNVVRMTEYQNRGLIKALEHFLELAKSGVISGAGGSVKFGPDDHRAYVFGDYLNHPSEALDAIRQLENELRRDLPKFSDSMTPH